MARSKTYLREWRKHRGLTQEDAAEAVKLSQPQLSKIEQGKHPYDQDLLEVLASVYECTVADLLSRAPQQEAEVIDIWDRISEANRAQARLTLLSFVGEKSAK